MTTATEIRQGSKSVWKIAALILVVALGLILGLAWFSSYAQSRGLIREIEGLNGKARTTYTINTFIPGFKFQMGDLKDVSLLGPHVDDRKLAILEKAPRLRVLSLTNTRVTDEGLARLSQFQDLNLLTLANIDLTKNKGPASARLSTLPLTGGKGLEALKDLPDLEWVRLMGPGTTDFDLKGVAQIKKLIKLELLGTRVTDQGVAEFKKALPGCLVIRRP